MGMTFVVKGVCWGVGVGGLCTLCRPSIHTDSFASSIFLAVLMYPGTHTTFSDSKFAPSDVVHWHTVVY
jgi:hypothetical protein